jgi:hypothetical protein
MVWTKVPFLSSWILHCLLFLPLNKRIRHACVFFAAFWLMAARLISLSSSTMDLNIPPTGPFFHISLLFLQEKVRA